MAEDVASTADLFEIIQTTRSMRRLKQDPVPEALIRKVLEAGVCAPSGGNMHLTNFPILGAGAARLITDRELVRRA